MNEEKKKPEEEKAKEGAAEQDESKAEVKEEKPEPEAPDAGGNDSGESSPEDEAATEKKSSESEEKKESVPPSADEKDEEILRLKTKIAAMEIGISADCTDDAVAIAENYVKSGKANDINTALAEVVKKYPAMKGKSSENKKGGFKVGADSQQKETNSSDDRISAAFGIRKKK